MWTFLPDYFVCQHTSKVAFDKIWAIFQLIFDSIKEKTRELINIHLFVDTGWTPIWILKWSAERLGIMGLSVQFLKGNKNILELIQQILAIVYFSSLWVLRFENRLAQGWNHIHLLEETVHIAYTAWILQSNIARRTFLIYFV